MGSAKNITALAVATGACLLTRSAMRRLFEYDLRNKVVFITGGSRGLGLVLAREFGSQGAHLAICARDTEELRAANEDLKSRGVDVLPIECDITNRKQIEHALSYASNHYGKIDVLVNNAGVIEVGPLEVMTVEDFQMTMNTHFWGPLYATLAVLPQMQKRREGRIVNIASIGGKVSVPHLVPYCASKFALVGLSEGVRAETLKYGIRVTTVCPGLMRTGSARNAQFKGKHRAEFALFSLGASSPLTSIKAERAAKQIVDACKRGDAEITLSLQAKLVALFHGVFPGEVADLMGAINYLLPEPGGIGENKVTGIESSSFIAPSILTKLNDQAAVTNNEVRHIKPGYGARLSSNH